MTGKRMPVCTMLLPGVLALTFFSSCQPKSVPSNSTMPAAEGPVAGPEEVRVEGIPEPGGASAAALIDAYNSRDLGSPGRRRVLMELKTGGAVTRSFTVVNLWRADGTEVRTLFLLEDPEGLRGTSYLLREGVGEMPDIGVSLFLPAGERRVLQVAPSNFDEGLLGSDFSYADVRMRLPVDGYRYTVKGRGSLLNEPVWVVEAEPTAARTHEASSWSVARLYLARNFTFLLGADYYANSGREAGALTLLKQMRVQSVERIGGAWTATRMTMTARDNHSSVLTLKEFEFNSAEVIPEDFSPERLPLLSEKVKQGWTSRTLPSKGH